MAYAHGKYQVMMSSSGIDCSTSGVKGWKWAPGIVPHVVRGFALVNTSTLSDLSSLVVELQNRDHSAATTVTAVSTLNGTTGIGAGKVLYEDGLNKEIAVGDELQWDVTTAASVAATLQAIVYVEPHWETPANNTDMQATT